MRRPATFGVAVALVVALATSACSSNGSTAASPRPPNAKAGDASIGDSYYPGAGNGGIDVRNYALAIRTSPPEPAIRATATVTIRATHALRSFHLDFRGLTVDDVRVDDRDATFEHTAAELVVRPARPIARGRTFTVPVR
jgi:aminopeptidase N